MYSPGQESVSTGAWLGAVDPVHSLLFHKARKTIPIVHSLHHSMLVPRNERGSFHNLAGVRLPVYFVVNIYGRSFSRATGTRRDGRNGASQKEIFVRVTDERTGRIGTQSCGQPLQNQSSIVVVAVLLSMSISVSVESSFISLFNCSLCSCPCL